MLPLAATSLATNPPAPSNTPITTTMATSFRKDPPIQGLTRPSRPTKEPRETRSINRRGKGRARDPWMRYLAAPRPLADRTARSRDTRVDRIRETTLEQACRQAGGEEAANSEEAADGRRKSLPCRHQGRPLSHVVDAIGGRCQDDSRKLMTAIETSRHRVGETGTEKVIGVGVLDELIGRCLELLALWFCSVGSAPGWKVGLAAEKGRCLEL
jgi:hypothetical protein